MRGHVKARRGARRHPLRVSGFAPSRPVPEDVPLLLRRLDRAEPREADTRDGNRYVSEYLPTQVDEVTFSCASYRAVDVDWDGLLVRVQLLRRVRVVVDVDYCTLAFLEGEGGAERSAL